MPDQDGSFIWYDLVTDDPEASRTFYEAVVGWRVEAYPGGDAAPGPDDYRLLIAPDGAGVGGVMKLPAAGMQPAWLGYLSVDDVDRAAEGIAAAGGSIIVPPTDIPNVGRFAFVSDPAGTPFYIMRGCSSEESRAFSATAIGHCAWNELNSAEVDVALDFYVDRFGWTRGDAMPMGAMGDYRFLHNRGERIGAAMQAPPGAAPGWSFYFGVANIDAAAAAIVASGGSIELGPIEVPGRDWIVRATDPPGAQFAIVGARA